MSAVMSYVVQCDSPGCTEKCAAGGPRFEVEARCKQQGWRVGHHNHWCPKHVTPAATISVPGARLIKAITERGPGAEVHVTKRGVQVARALVRRGILVDCGSNRYRMA